MAEHVLSILRHRYRFHHPQPTGIRNLGSTCFMASGLQLLFSIPSFTETFLSARWKDPSTLHSNDAQIFTVLKRGLQTLLRGETWCPMDWVEVFKYSDGSVLHPRQQEDVHEFLSGLLDCLIRVMHHTNQPNDLLHQIESQMMITLTCPNCGEISSHHEVQRCLSLEVQRADDIMSSLFQLIEPEVIDGKLLISIIDYEKKKRKYLVK